MPRNKTQDPPKAWILYRFAKLGVVSFLLRRGTEEKSKEITRSKKMDTKGGTGKEQVAGTE